MTRTTLPWRAAALVVLGALVPAAPATASTLIDSSLSVRSAKARDCHARQLGSAARGMDAVRLTAPANGYLSVTLKAARGDWDLAVFTRGGKRLVAGSASFGSRELAQGFVRGGQKLVIQACRRSGGARRARVVANLAEVDLDGSERPIKLIRIETPTRAHVERLATLGLDLTEHGDDDHREAVVYTEAEEGVLRAAGFDFTVAVPDLEAQSRADRLADRRFDRLTRSSDLPSGSDGYRRLVDFQAEMKQLVTDHPNLVKPLTLELTSLEGRPVEGIEITSDVDAQDGKPVFLMTGVHHAREWPSAENPMEFAYDLIKGYGTDERTTRLVDATRTIVVPVMNVDGFNLSREAPNEGTRFEYKRKNCRVVDGQVPTPGQCAQMPEQSGTGAGVDPNRNYGGDWGGPGASTLFADATYRGAGQFSEPEVENVRRLISKRQVTTFITNHTHGSLVLRPPGIAAFGPAKDEVIYKDLGDRMAEHNEYTSQYSWQLYDTSGTAEAWSYYATGGLGFTFEIHQGNFHRTYSDAVVKEYLGETSRGGAGGNREAYFTALENTANPAMHSVLSGRALPGTELTLSKSFTTTTSRVQPPLAQLPWGAPIDFQDELETTMTTTKGGHFEWHVNPSTRPDVYGGRAATGPTTVDFTFTGNGGAPNETVLQEKEFTVAPGDDNAAMKVRVEWASNATQDWSLELLRKDADGTRTRISRSAVSGRNFEEVETVHAGPGTYVVRLQELTLLGVAGQGVSRPDAATPFTATVDFVAPQPPEAWTLTCRSANGKRTDTRQVVVDRGQRVDLGNVCVQP